MQSNTGGSRTAEMPVTWHSFQRKLQIAKQSLFKRITIRSEFNIAVVVAFRAHIITPCASDGRHITLALNVCPVSFQSSLNKFSLTVLQFFSFGIGVFAHA